MKTFKFRGLEFPSWAAFFLIFGILSGLMFIICGSASPDYGIIGKIRPFALGLPIAFVFFYIVFGTYFFPKKVFPDVVMYGVGCFGGFIISFVIGFLLLLFTGGYFLVKFLISLF